MKLFSDNFYFVTKVLCILSLSFSLSLSLSLSLLYMYIKDGKKLELKLSFSVIFNEICLKENMTPKYTICTHTHTHTYIYIYGGYLTPLHEQNLTEGQYLSGVLQVLIQSFPSSRLDGIARLKSSVCPTLYRYRDKEFCIYTFPNGISAR